MRSLRRGGGRSATRQQGGKGGLSNALGGKGGDVSAAGSYVGCPRSAAEARFKALNLECIAGDKDWIREMAPETRRRGK